MQPIYLILLTHYKKKIVIEFSKIKKLIDEDFEKNNPDASNKHI